MPVSYGQAQQKLEEWTENPSLRKHARSVEVVMRAAAHKYGNGPDDEDSWGIAGLLHDADYERWPSEHPRKVVSWLRERGDAEIAHAISAHCTVWNVPYKSAMDMALLACDELTGFIVAYCLVRPGGVTTLKPKSVKKKLKDRAFAAKVDRGEISAGVRILGVDLTDHIQLIIDALSPHAAELGIEGKEAS